MNKSDLALLFVGPMEHFTWLADNRFHLVGSSPNMDGTRSGVVITENWERLEIPNAVLLWSVPAQLWITCWNGITTMHPRIAPYYKAEGVIELITGEPS